MQNVPDLVAIFNAKTYAFRCKKKCRATLAATISAVGHLPVAGLALILGIDRFMSEARALTNLVGNGVATVVVAKWVKELDQKKLTDTLNNRASSSKTGEISS